ncbi:hypothetical protein BG58_39410 [Caballeronia jiangsuensis]|nr:hypothetical protein BG58_39410 [Caballeronia jiangsuensis]
MESRPRRFLLLTVCGIALCLALLCPCARYIDALSALLVAWGICIICFGLAKQAHVLQLAADAKDIATAMFSGLYNIGIGCGALLGKVVARDVGLEWTGGLGAMVAAVAVAAGLVAFITSRRLAKFSLNVAS